MNKYYWPFKKNQWFFEAFSPYDETGPKIGFKIRKKLYSGKSVYQKIEVAELFYFGRTLFLDGIIQTTEKDEFIYHEMLGHLPIFYHRNPQKVLIIGGGDGGILEEVLKHPIESVWLVEIDEKVIEISQKYLPSISKDAFQDKRTKIIIQDGKEFIKNYQNLFDVIILDLSDPHGPAKDLISLKFYRNLKKALKEKGVISIQSGSLTVQPELVRTIFKRIKKIFSFVKIHRACVPSYQVGEHTFTLASDLNLEKISFENLKQRFQRFGFKLLYWSPEIHLYSATLPKYFKNFLKL